MIYLKIQNKPSGHIISSLYYDINNQSLEKLALGRLKKEENKKNGIKNNEKDDRSLRRTKAKIREYLECNLNYQSRFITLTYAENMQDYATATSDLNKMLTNLRKQEKQKLSFIRIMEHQGRGAIHFHLITFNMPELNFENYWKHGFVQHKNIDDLNIEKLTNYFAGYLTKKNANKDIDVGVRKFSKSNDLKTYETLKSNKMIMDALNYNITLATIKEKNFNIHRGLIDYQKYEILKQQLK